MNADQFAYWLQGFTELHGEPPTPAQWEMIKEHLGLVLNKVTRPVAGSGGAGGAPPPTKTFVMEPGGTWTYVAGSRPYPGLTGVGAC